MTKAECIMNRAALGAAGSRISNQRPQYATMVCRPEPQDPPTQILAQKIEPPAEPAVDWIPLHFSDPEPFLTVKVGPAAVEVRNGFDPQLLVAV